MYLIQVSILDPKIYIIYHRFNVVDSQVHPARSDRRSPKEDRLYTAKPSLNRTQRQHLHEAGDPRRISDSRQRHIQAAELDQTS